MKNLNQILSQSRKLMNNAMYAEAIQGYGKVLELLFKELYTEFLPKLSHLGKQKAINLEKEQNVSVEKFTVGQWIGMFREANFFSIIREKKGIVREISPRPCRPAITVKQARKNALFERILAGKMRIACNIFT